jgi:predicted RNA-binding protein with PIN domain
MMKQGVKDRGSGVQAMHYLIDGYNLLYAMGVLRGKAGPMGLEKARLRLLGLLRGAFGAAEAARVTVVFDAAGAAPGATEVQDYQGIQVRFAVRYEEADDLIEYLIGHNSAPRRLSVVSDDRRIQQAARRRRCLVVACDSFLRWLDRHRRDRRARLPQAGAKPGKLSAAETQRWLDEFADLQDEPHAIELFELDNFAVDESDMG